MDDFITAGDSAGTSTTTYNYTVSVHGTQSPWLTLAGTDLGRTSAFVSFFVSSLRFACNKVVANRSPAVGLSNFSCGGSFSVPTGTKFEIGLGPPGLAARTFFSRTTKESP